MITLSNITKQYGRRVILMDASFQLNPGEKIGLVGFYRPRRKRSDMVGAEMRSLARRAFGGSLPAMADGLLSLDDLDLDELAAIKARIAERERELREDEG